jgi:aryl-phospho-beta-D-glucosidase BglC (GH1 family)
MKKYLIILPLFFLINSLTPTFSQEIYNNELTGIPNWYNTQLPPGPKPNKNIALPLITVKGNKFVNAKGDTMLFRGLAFADPDKIEAEGQWNKELFQRLKDLGANLIRIPIHPIAWRNRTPNTYLKLLDQAVNWSTELGLYIIIDWHSIGNLKAGLFQDPYYITSLTETLSFWRTIAQHFSGNNTVAFYELFNEPTLYNGQLGRMTWSEWREINKEMIELIRAFDKETIPLVAGFDWAYDLTPLAFDPVNAEGIGYVTHPYGHKRTPPFEPKWEENFGFASGQFPIFATEFGFTLGDISMKDNFEYGKAIITYLEDKGISWAWWVYDPHWWPQMIKSWKSHELTDNGKFFKDAADGTVGN